MVRKGTPRSAKPGKEVEASRLSSETKKWSLFQEAFSLSISATNAKAALFPALGAFPAAFSLIPLINAINWTTPNVLNATGLQSASPSSLCYRYLAISRARSDFLGRGSKIQSGESHGRLSPLPPPSPSSRPPGKSRVARLRRHSRPERVLARG